MRGLRVGQVVLLLLCLMYFITSWMVGTCLLLTAVALVPLMFVHDTGVSLVCLSAGFFFAEMTIGPMWAIPMDIAPAYSGTASGMMNTGSALAAIVSPVVSGYLIDRFHSWELPFVCDMLLAATGLALTFRMRPESRFTAPFETPWASPTARTG
jgi:ACS family glucarate transporter-like MFS transporter